MKKEEIFKMANKIFSNIRAEIATLFATNRIEPDLESIPIKPANIQSDISQSKMKTPESKGPSSWMKFSYDRIDDPFLKELEATLLDMTIPAKEAAIAQHLGVIYIRGGLEVRVEEGEKSIYRLTDDGIVYLVSTLTSAFTPTPEA